MYMYMPLHIHVHVPVQNFIMCEHLLQTYSDTGFLILTFQGSHITLQLNSCIITTATD